MPLAAEIVSLLWGTPPANFNGFCVSASLLQRRRSTELVNQTLHCVWPSPGLVRYIHFRELLPPDGILPRAKFTLCPSTHHRTRFLGYTFATKAFADNRKKSLLNSNMSSTRPHNMVNFGPLAAEIGSGVWGTPANFNGFRILAALLHGTLVVYVSQTLRRGT